MMGGGGNMKNSGILLCSKRMPSGRGCGVNRKASGGQKEHLRSHRPTSPVKRPRTCGLILVPEAHPETPLWPA